MAGNPLSDQFRRMKEGNPEDYYPKILQHRGKLLGLFLTIGFLSFLITGVIFWTVFDRLPWMSAVTPAVLLGSLVTLYPPCEQWLYRPWQAVAQQVERHFYDV